jgi:hypothetical protein
MLWIPEAMGLHPLYPIYLTLHFFLVLRYTIFQPPPPPHIFLLLKFVTFCYGSKGHADGF